MSDALLYLQPVFILAPVLLLALLVLGLGWQLVALLVLADGVAEILSTRRALRRARAQERLDEPEEREADADGIPLTRADGHPRLWAVVDESAAAAQIAPPARIVLSLATAAAVVRIPPAAPGAADPGTAQAGSDASSYELRLSPALLAQAQVPHLKAVLAHEMGHVAAGSLTPPTGAQDFARRWAGPLYDAVPRWGWLKLGGWVHLRLWLVVDAWANRPVEHAADDLAFRLAGPRTTAAALSGIDRLDAAQGLVEDQYLPLAMRARLRPSVLEAIHQVLATPAGGRLDAHLTAAKPGAIGRIHSTHPTTAQRIAAAERAAADGRGVDADARAASAGPAPAVELLDGGVGWLIAREAQLYVERHVLLDAPPADWATVIDVGGRGLIADAVDNLVAAATTPADPKGNLVPLDGPVTAYLRARPEEVTARQFLATADQVGLPALLHEPELDGPTTAMVLALVAARAFDRGGRLRRSLSWSGPATCEYHDGTRWWPLRTVEGDAAPGPADSPLDVAIRDVAARRSLAARLIDGLAAAGAEIDAPVGLTSSERSARPGDFLGAEAGVTVHRGDEQLGETWIALVGTSGVWLVPDGPRLSWLDAAERESEVKQRMRDVAHAFDVAGRPDLDRWPGSLWLPEVELAEVRTRGTLTVHVDLVGVDGQVTSLRLQSTAPWEGRQVVQALPDMVGNRLSVA